MNTMLIAHLGDIHLDERNKFTETAECLRWAVADAAHRGAGAILIAGDVFERASTPRERLALRESLMLAGRTPVFIVRGNHDADLDLELFAGDGDMPRVAYYDRPGITDVLRDGERIGVVACLPWPQKRWLQAGALANGGALDPETADHAAAAAMRTILLGFRADLARARAAGLPTVLLAHLTVAGSVLSTGQTMIGREIELGIHDLAEVGADYVALGHIHKYQTFDENIAYGGSLTRRNFGEAEEKGYLFVAVRQGEHPVIEFIASPCRPMILIEHEWPAAGEMTHVELNSCPTADVRLRWHYPEVEREQVAAAAETARKQILAAGAASVKIEMIARPAARARGAEIVAARTPADKLAAYWSERHPELTAERLARLRFKFDALPVAVTSAGGRSPLLLRRMSWRGVATFRERQEIDFSALGRVVAVRGPNGAGKSTLLELPLVALYRDSPSRGGLDKTAQDRKSYVDAEVGEHRALVTADAVSGRIEAYLYGADGGALAGPKVREFDTAVAGIFPPLDLVLASTFAAQNRAGDLINMTAGGRKDVLAELLALGSWESLADGARKEAAETRTALAKIDGRAEELSRLAGDSVCALDNSIAMHEAAAAKIEMEIVALTDAETNAVAQAEVLRAAMAQAAHRRAERDAAASEMQSAAAEIERIDRQRPVFAEIIARATEIDRAAADETPAEADLDAARKGATAARLGLVRATDAKGAADRKAFEATENLKRLRVARDARRVEIERLAVALLCTPDRAEAEHELIAARDAVVGARQREHAARREVADTTYLHTKHQAAERVLADARKRRALLDETPCRGAGEYAACGLLADAVAAAATIAETKTTIAEVTQEARAINGQTTPAAAMQSAQAALVDVERDLAAALDAERLAEAQHKRATDAAGQQATLAACREQALVLDGQIDAAADAEAAALAGALAAREALDVARAADAQALGAKNHAQTRRETLRSIAAQAPALARARAKVEEMDVAYDLAGQRKVEAEERLRRFCDVDAGSQASALAGAENRAVEARQAVTAARLSFGLHHAEKAVLCVRRQEMIKTTRAREALLAERASMLESCDDWGILAKACGREGVPALEIDQAGPQISAVTNDLLVACFGGRFSLAIETTRQSGDGKKTLDDLVLRVIDNERGWTGDIKSLSGGEQVLVREALSLAIAIFNADRSGIAPGTLFRDECAGALDVDNARQYIVMLRRALDIGRFPQVLFVAHQPELWALADNQIVVADGAVEVI